MGQIKVYGLRSNLHPIREKVSEIIHECIVLAFSYPKEKKAHRFIYIEDDSYFYFSERIPKHILIEMLVFEGRSLLAKKKLYQLLFERFQEELQINAIDLEITLIETPLHNWGIRGKSGDYLQLNYSISV